MDYIGYEYLRQHLSLTAFAPRRPARISPVTRVMAVEDRLLVPAQVAPRDGDVLAHVLFALKHEGVNLQILAQAMPHLAPERLLAALDQASNGRYLRVAGYLWEGLTGQQLPGGPSVSGRYVDVFDPDRYATGPAQRDARWRVNFNGLGSLRYCATVERTPAIEAGMASDILSRTHDFLQGLGAVMQDRALTWAYLHETENSYAIEREKPTEDKARAFVQLLQLAHEGRRLSEDTLVELQSATVTNPFDKAVAFRNEQNWLHGPGRGAAGITYVPPWPGLAAQLMQEWMAFANEAPRQIDPIIAASVVSFGFVFIHPFMDGNGRLSRFLFHQALCNSGKLAKGQLLPVSVAMKHNEADYLETLQTYSKPVRERVQVTWIDEGEYAFEFQADEAIFRFWDATACVEFGFRMAAQALDIELKREAVFLQRFDEAMRRVNAQIDLRSNDLATLIAICMDNDGLISGRKRKRFADRIPSRAFDLIEAAVRDVLMVSPGIITEADPARQ